MPPMQATLVGVGPILSVSSVSWLLAEIGVSVHKNGEFINKVSECQILKAVQSGNRLKTIILLADGVLPDQCHSAFLTRDTV